jgi:succinate dehydrogenase hydrophobic anchor subunit
VTVIMQTGVGAPPDVAAGERPSVPEPPADPGWATPLLHATGALLLILVPLHILGLLLYPENLAELALLDRWDNPAWLLVDWAFLAVGCLHAVTALWVRVDRSSLDERRQTLVVATVGGATAAMFGAASWSMLLLV